MQSGWPRQVQVRRRQLEPYPAPAVGAPAPWPGEPAAPPHGISAHGEGGQNGELEGVYIISVAARLLEMHPQTLRKYERLGLIHPVRTVGMLRLYSQEDLRKVMLIRHLMDNLGLNHAGVEFALKLVNNLGVFSQRLTRSTGDAALAEQIREEIALLCHSLGLPTPDQPTNSNRSSNHSGDTK